jgi:hypothetical protein
LRGNCILQVTEGNTKGRIEVVGRRGRRRKQLLDDLEKTRYHKLKEEALIALCGKLVLEEAMDLSLDKLRTAAANCEIF